MSLTQCIQRATKDAIANHIDGKRVKKLSVQVNFEFDENWELKIWECRIDWKWWRCNGKNLFQKILVHRFEVLLKVRLDCFYCILQFSDLFVIHCLPLLAWHCVYINEIKCFRVLTECVDQLWKWAVGILTQVFTTKHERSLVIFNAKRWIPPDKTPYPWWSSAVCVVQAVKVPCSGLWWCCRFWKPLDPCTADKWQWWIRQHATP